MLNELGQVARSNGWVVIHVTVGPAMLDRIAQRASAHRQELDAPDRQPGTATWSIKTPLGGVTREAQTPGAGARPWGDDVSALLEVLAPYGTGLCITVDEIHSLDVEQMQALAGDIQMIIREGLPIALVMAGLPIVVEDLLAGETRPTTFLRRAERPVLRDVPVTDVADSFLEIVTAAGRTLTDDLALECARATNGYPFMIQLVGYHTWRQGGTGPITAEHVAAQARLGALVHEPALADLSAVDRTFLVKMAEDDGPSQLADIASRMGKSSQYAGVYRDRLMKAGMIQSPRYGQITFDAPYLREYLRDHAAHLMAEGQERR